MDGIVQNIIFLLLMSPSSNVEK